MKNLMSWFRHFGSFLGDGPRAYSRLPITKREEAFARWWLQIFCIFTPKIGEDEPILTHIFQLG